MLLNHVLFVPLAAKCYAPGPPYKCYVQTGLAASRTSAGKCDTATCVTSYTASGTFPKPSCTTPNGIWDFGSSVTCSGRYGRTS